MGNARTRINLGTFWIVSYMWNRNVKITYEDITYGPKDDPDELTAVTFAYNLEESGYRRVSNAYCRVARIDREDWLDILAENRRCSRADFYNVDGSGIGDQHRDHYVRVYSKDVLVVHPAIIKHIMPWR